MQAHARAMAVARLPGPPVVQLVRTLGRYWRVVAAAIVLALAVVITGADPGVKARHAGAVAAAAAAVLLLVHVATVLVPQLAASTRIAAAQRRLRNPTTDVDLPGPVPTSPDGNAGLWLDGAHRGDFMSALLAVSKEHGPTFAVYFGHRPCVVVGGVDGIEFVVRNESKFDKGTDYDIARVLLGNGMLTSNGATWKCVRKASRGLFSAKALQGLASDVDALMDQSLPDFRDIAQQPRTTRHGRPGAPRKHQTGVVVDMYDHAMYAFISATCTHFFSQELPTERVNDLMHTLNCLVDGMRTRMDGLHLPVQWWQHTPAVFSEHNAAMTHCKKLLQNVARVWIHTRRVTPAERRPNDLLSAWVGAQEATLEGDAGALPMGKGDDQIVDELLSVMLVGHDASSACIAWTMHLLATHPRVQDRLRAELRFATSPQDIQQMSYLNAVLKEAMRLYPPAALYGRRPLADVTVDGVHVPKGTFMLVAPYLLHRHEQHFGDDASVFNPGRFLPGAPGAAAAGGSAPRYLPFSYGPRNCIGQNAAMVEMKAYVAKVVAGFRVSPAPAGVRGPQSTPPTAVLSGLVIRPAGGMPCLLTPL